MESAPFIIHTDGGSRGNPGPAAYGFVLTRPGAPDLEENDFIKQATNNIAEYTAVVRALERAKELGAERVIIKSDSELMVKQMNGQYKVKNEGLLPFYLEAVELRRGFKNVQFQHVRREYNKDADRLCNDAMDARGSTTGRVPIAKPDKPVLRETPEVADDADPLRQAGIALLRKAALAWEEGETSPTVDEVWEEMRTLFQQHE